MKVLPFFSPYFTSYASACGSSFSRHWLAVQACVFIKKRAVIGSLGFVYSGLVWGMQGVLGF